MDQVVFDQMGLDQVVSNCQQYPRWIYVTAANALVCFDIKSCYLKQVQKFTPSKIYIPLNILFYINSSIYLMQNDLGKIITAWYPLIIMNSYF